jgi:membrane-bound ClpP family serine protease
MLASIAILTLFGILLIMLETFLPGWVAGILGVISIVAAVCVALTLFSEELAGLELRRAADARPGCSWCFPQLILLVPGCAGLQ